MVFPWLVFVLLVLALALVIASTPGRIRSYRSHGADPFVYPAVATVALVAIVLGGLFVTWLFLFGPVD